MPYVHMVEHKINKNLILKTLLVKGKGMGSPGNLLCLFVTWVLPWGSPDNCTDVYLPIWCFHSIAIICGPVFPLPLVMTTLRGGRCFSEHSSMHKVKPQDDLSDIVCGNNPCRVLGVYNNHLIVLGFTQNHIKLITLQFVESIIAPFSWEKKKFKNRNLFSHPGSQLLTMIHTCHLRVLLEAGVVCVCSRPDLP